MSISTGEDKNQKSVLKRDTAMPVINIRQTASSIIKNLPKKTLDVILIIGFITTAFGELFGRDYGWKWYGLLLLLLAAFVVKEVVDPAPKEDKKSVPLDD